MSAERASLYVQEPNRFTLEVVASEKAAYDGEERRMETRRQGKDRRIDVRFNLTKQDRRENVGRRAEDVLPKFW
ncbi:Uncharacterised protein [Halioglobus japonicus]|nr:Uncharacterised protein [Halioglobus japonicus]